MAKETTDTSLFFEKYGTPIALLLGLIIIAGAIYFGSGMRPQTTTPAQQENPDVVDVKSIKTNGVPFIGNANAPVTVVLWFDYQCPFCKQFETTTMTNVYNDYVKSGKVKIVLKDLQFLGPDSTTDGGFARAVWNVAPDHFYDWYRAMADHQDGENKDFGDLKSVEDMTRSVAGIDADKVIADYTKNKAKYESALDASKTEAAALGINSTPIVVIGTTVVRGAQAYDKIKPLIDAELAK